MRALVLLLPVLLVLAGCKQDPSAAAAGNPDSRDLFLVPLELPEVSGNAPNPQYVTTDIARADYTCVDGTNAPEPRVSQHAYPGGTLKLCTDVSSPNTIPQMVADNIRSLCVTSGRSLASFIPYGQTAPISRYAIFGISAVNAQGRPARVRLTGAPCPAASVLNGSGK